MFPIFDRPKKELKPAVNWHYARPEMAKIHYDSLISGPSHSTAFFGMRRIGKTQFLYSDFIPHAESQGDAVVYCSLWGDMDSPANAIATALEALLDKGVSGKTSAKISLAAEAAPGIEASFGLEIERDTKPSEVSKSDIRRLNELFRRFCQYKPNQNKILVIDEIQTIGTKKEHYPLAAALRTFLDIAPDNVKAVFTGSSKMGLREMFEFTKAPFYNFASIVNFPIMDRGFADHLSECLKKASGRQIDTSGQIWKVFTECGGNAAETVNVVEKALKTGSSEISAIWEARKNDILGVGGYCERKWRDFTDAERLAYLMVSEHRHPYDKAAFEVYEEAGFSRSMMQRAYAKLMDHSFINETNRVSHQNLNLFDVWFQEQGLNVDSYMLQLRLEAADSAEDFDEDDRDSSGPRG